MVTFNIAILIFLLIFSVYFDLKERRIPNIITAPVIVWAIVSTTIDSGFNGFLFSMSGLILGLAVFFIPFVLGGMGAGDVKLMAAIGSLMGWTFIMKSALLTAITGGIMVLIYTIYTGELWNVLGNIIGWGTKPILSLLYLKTGNKKILNAYERIVNKESKVTKAYIPYGVAIAVGTLIVLFWNNKGITF